MDWQIIPSLQRSHTDYYAILGVDKSASFEAIQEAYEKYSLLCHPAVPCYDPSLLPLQTLSQAEYWTCLNQAYEVLSNEQFRLVYDTAGEEGLRNDTIVHACGPDASYEPSNPWTVFGIFVFDHLLQGRASNGCMEKLCSHASSREDFVITPPPSYYSIGLTLEELFSGTGKVVRYERMKTANGVSKAFETIVRVKFQAGMRHGESICLPRMGNMDLHLSTMLMVPLKTALTGGVMPVHCIDGKTIQLEITEPCRPWRDIVLPGEGMPDPITGRRGNMYVRVMVQFPAKIPIRAKRELSRILDKI